MKGNTSLKSAKKTKFSNQKSRNSAKLPGMQKGGKIDSNTRAVDTKPKLYGGEN